MSKAPAFQLYAGDFLTDVMDWTDEQVGAHIRLMCWSWVNRRGIPRDTQRLTRIAPGAVEAWPVIGSKWKEGPDDTWINERLESTRADSDAFRARQKEKSELAVTARKEKGTRVGRKRKPVDISNGIPKGAPDGVPSGYPLEGEGEVSVLNSVEKERARAMVERIADFAAEVRRVNGEKRTLPEHELEKFIMYWTQAGTHDRKFHAEKQQTFGIAARLMTWGSRSTGTAQPPPHQTAERKDLVTDWDYKSKRA